MRQKSDETHKFKYIVDLFRRTLFCFVSLCFRFKVVASFVEGNIRIEMFLAKCSGDRGFF